MHDTERMDDYNYRDTMNYRDGMNYRNYRDYRDDYRNYRDDYRRDRRNYRDRYGRNYRSQDDYTMMLEDSIDDAMELSRTYEDLSEMTNNSNEKQKLMKMAEREKEHYRTSKEILQSHM